MGQRVWMRFFGGGLRKGFESQMQNLKERL